jgi:hypothetical protein
MYLSKETLFRAAEKVKLTGKINRLKRAFTTMYKVLHTQEILIHPLILLTSPQSKPAWD